MNADRTPCPACASRRSFIGSCAALGAGLLLPSGARAGEVRDLSGEVRVNGRLIGKPLTVYPGDHIVTGPTGSLAVVIEKDAMLIRPGSQMRLQPDGPLLAGLRIITGAVLAVFGPGRNRRLEVPTATMGIRGTGVYLEVMPEASYLCTCYGRTEISDAAGTETREVEATNHNAMYVYGKPQPGGRIASAPLINHTNEELSMLEGLVGRKAPWDR